MAACLGLVSRPWKRTRFAPAQLHVVLSMERFCFQVIKNGEDFASNPNPIAKFFLF